MSVEEIEEDGELKHYGILRKSGRYPWGSGETEYARSQTFQGMVATLKSQGVDYKDMAKAMGLDPEKFTLTQLRDTITIAKEEVVREQTQQASALKDKGWSVQAISDKMGIPASTVALRIKNNEALKKESLKNTAEAVRSEVDKHQIVDIGKGTNIGMGISPERLRAAVSILRDEGYETYTLQQRMPGSKHLQNQLVIVPKGTGFGGAARMADRVHTMTKWSEDEGKTYLGTHPPMSLNSKRLKVVYSEDGGTQRDGLIEVRAGVPDLSIGKNQYAQVRIAVDGNKFIKGMAVVRDDMPPGPDVVFHTNKSKAKGLDGALKPMKDDPENPFGSSIKRQIVEIDKNGKEQVKSVMNIVNEAGDWETWSNSLPSQMLAKQPQPLIRSQLTETVKDKQARVAKINSMTNPLLRKKLLEKEADQIDSDAVDLRAVAMPHQKTQVIIPIPKMSPNEVYAPNFKTGEKVVLIRYPHGGRFEIPEVIVNNNNRTAKKLLGNAIDAIGIHPKVAEKLSGADFDGDTVVVIPNGKGKIRGSTTLGLSARVYEKGLNDFDPKRKYFEPPIGKGKDKDGKEIDIYPYPVMKNTGLEMGKITNLITDMSIQGAKPEHMVRAIRHSMVVIDAEKHSLDYKRSAIENGITQLNQIYRGKEKSGAATLLSRATATERIPERKLRGAREGGPIDPKTGEKVYVNTNKMINKYDPKTQTYDPNVKVPRTQNEKLLALTNDARTLVSDRNDPVELIYAAHANTMKGLANQTRLAASRIPTPKMNPAAKKVYKAEVDEMVRQLREIQGQKPLDRKANVIANALIKQRRLDDPTLRLDQDRMKKVERQVKQSVRDKMGLKKQEIDLTDRMWDAIQAGALSSNRFGEMLDGNYIPDKRLYELALPKKNTVMTSAITSRAKAMLAAGMTNADIAAALGVSASTIRAAAVRGDL